MPETRSPRARVAQFDRPRRVRPAHRAPHGIVADDVARAVHDIASPLTVLVGLCFAVRRRTADAVIVADVGRIEAEVERISDRLDALLALARGGAGRGGAVRAPLCLAAVVRDVAARASALAQRSSVRLQAEMGDGEIVVNGDARALEAAIENLVTNAVRHAGAGGTVWLAAAQGDRNAVLHVADDGPGVHPADRERIFRPHVRGQGATGPGQGLGLAIARETARDHGGELVLEPSAAGAVFRLSLPLAVLPAHRWESGAA